MSSSRQHVNSLVDSYIFKFCQDAFLPLQLLDEEDALPGQHDAGTSKQLPGDLEKILLMIVFFASKLSRRPVESFDFLGLCVYYAIDSGLKNYTDSLFLELLASADPLTGDALSSLVHVLVNDDDFVGEQILHSEGNVVGTWHDLIQFRRATNGQAMGQCRRNL